MALSNKSNWNDLIAAYRELVTAEPSQEALERCIILMQYVAGARPIINDGLDQELAELDQQDKLVANQRKQLSEDLVDFLAERWKREAVGRRRRREYLRLQQLAHRTAGALWTPVFLRTHDIPIPERAFSLAVDVGLVVFHQAYFWLLDQLPRTFQRERDALYAAFYEFSEILPSLPDSLWVKAFILELSGEVTMAGWYLREAVRRTRSDNHEFLTVLQSAWSYLVERDRYRNALILLQENNHRVRESDYAEFRELFALTADLERRAVAEVEA